VSSQTSRAVDGRHTFFATCAPGIEGLLHDEARALKLSKLERQVGGVRFEGAWSDAWRANLWLRTAVRVLARLERFQATDADELYRRVQRVDWTSWLSSEQSLIVSAQSKESALDHTRFIEQRVKDAIVDQFRARSLPRPSVNKDAPDLSVHVHLYRDRCTLSLDTSGDSLHKRGWRRFQGRAPLAETLAAALLLRSGWDRRSPLVDPFCGSATILLAAGRAPGLSRPGFAFERLPGFEPQTWDRLRLEAERAQRPPAKLRLVGIDADEVQLAGARENLAGLDLSERIELVHGRAEDFEYKRGWNAWIVTNPPYGERVGEERELAPVYRRLGETWRERCGGWRVALLSGNPNLARELGLAPRRTTALANGALECELLEFELPSPS
jgi:putative N6-adenine-specific DNA methylase